MPPIRRTQDAQRLDSESVALQLVGLNVKFQLIPDRAYLLREFYRVGDKVRERTLPNLSSLPDAQISAIRAVRKGQRLAPVYPLFDVVESREHGHVQVVSLAMSRLIRPGLIPACPCRERGLVLAMLAARILAPYTKLATTRWWHTTTAIRELRRRRRRLE